MYFLCHNVPNTRHQRDILEQQSRLPLLFCGWWASKKPAQLYWLSKYLLLFYAAVAIATATGLLPKLFIKRQWEATAADIVS